MFATLARAIWGSADELLEDWPMQRMEAQLVEALADEPTAGRGKDDLVVIIMCGSLAPVHLGHRAVLESAKTSLNSRPNTRVVGGFLSATHGPGYVNDKMARKGYAPIADRHRVGMAKALLSESTWAAASAWEVAQTAPPALLRTWGQHDQRPQVILARIDGDGPEVNTNGFNDFPVVCVAAKYMITKLVRNNPKIARAAERLKFWFACGADHADLCHLFSRQPTWADGVVVLGRPGTHGPATTTATDWYRYVALPDDGKDISSTAIRDRVMEGESIEDVVGPHVQKYIANNRVTFLRK